MRTSVFIAFLISVFSMSLLTTGCFSDLEAYDDFVCERFGGDADEDGDCSMFDCNDYDPMIYKGAPCDDGNEETINDVITENCECVGQ